MEISRRMETISVETNAREELIDITEKVQDILKRSKVKEGICIVESMHTTAGITINENADPDVKTDILKGLKIFDQDGYDHAEGNSPAHIKTSCMGLSQTIIIHEGKLRLGTWQGIMFCEFDGPRSRKVSVQVVNRA
jgi:secondary thiamine-phosphate synthase enzyme